VVTRRVAEAVAVSVRENPLKEQLGRTGKAFKSCEDDDFSWAACTMGGGRGVFTEPRVTYLIPRGRLQKGYLPRRAGGHAHSRTLLWHLQGEDRSVVRPVAPSTHLLQLARGMKVRARGSEIMHHLRILSQGAIRREFRQASWRGMRRAREIIASGGMTAGKQAGAG
jgi:hypothetical protein